MQNKGPGSFKTSIMQHVEKVSARYHPGARTILRIERIKHASTWRITRKVLGKVSAIKSLAPIL